jgi:ABC-type sulfate/molybdate transport systems ATPase subunit
LELSAAYELNAALKRWTRTLHGSVVTALLQPTPETYELFDDVILMREGTIVYHGPQSDVIPIWLH